MKQWLRQLQSYHVTVFSDHAYFQVIDRYILGKGDRTFTFSKTHDTLALPLWQRNRLEMPLHTHTCVCCVYVCVCVYMCL